MQFNEKLKKLRQERGVTQKELADAVYVSRSAVAKWENGLGLPNAESLSLLAKFFGVEEQVLMTDSAVETVIVGKNGVMMRQRQVIFGLAAIFLIILTIVIAVFAANLRDAKERIKPTVKTESPIVSRELVFDTELELDVSDFPVYKDVIFPTYNFAASRTFRVSWDKNTVTMPTIMVRERRQDGSITYKHDLNGQDLEHFSISQQSSLMKMVFNVGNTPYLFMIQMAVYDDAPEYEHCFNINYKDLTMSVKVYKNTLVREKVEILPRDGIYKVELASSQSFSVEMSEAYAYNRDHVTEIQKVEFPNGTCITENCSDYAYLGFDSEDPNIEILYTTDKIPVGSKITVGVTADEKRVSTTAEFEVGRIPVDNIQVSMGIGSNILEAGKSYTCTVRAYPEYSTFNILHEEFELTSKYPETVSVERFENGWTVTVTKDRELLRDEINLTVTLPEGAIFNSRWSIQNEEVEHINVVYAETGESVSGPLFLHRGDIIPFRVMVVPADAAYSSIEYSIYRGHEYDEYFNLSEDGILTINEDAPYGMELDLEFGVHTRWHKICMYRTVIVEGKPIEEVVLSCETTLLERGTKAGENAEENVKEYELAVRCSPEDSLIVRQEFRLLDGYVSGVKLEGNKIIVYASARNYAQFRVQATVNGVKSNILTFTVIPPKAESITIDVSRHKVKREVLHEVYIDLEPFDADLKNVRLNLLEDVEGVYIIENKYLFIASNVEAGTVIRIQATADGIESNILELTVI